MKYWFIGLALLIGCGKAEFIHDGAHTARRDVEMSVEVYKNLVKLIK